MDDLQHTDFHQIFDMLTFMKPAVPLLVPLLRSNTQGEILAALYLFPDVERTASELARKAGVSLPTVLRELDRLTSSGFLTARTSGRNRYVRVNREHPLFPAVATIVQYGYGPLALLPEILRGVAGVEKAFIYGSWAARFDGESGPDPQDIDVIVVGDIDRTELFEAAQRATKEIGRETNIRSATRRQWDDAKDLFLRNVKDRPLVPISLDEEHGA